MSIRKTSARADKEVIRTEHINFLRDEATASSYLLAYGITATNTLQILINAGVAYFGGDRVDFAGGYSPMMIVPDASSRIDVVSIASSAEIVVTVGVEADSPIAPAYPEANMPICQVYHRAGEVKITDEDDATNGYIYKDLRTFLRNETRVAIGINTFTGADGQTNNLVIGFVPRVILFSLNDVDPTDSNARVSAGFSIGVGATDNQCGGEMNFAFHIATDVNTKTRGKVTTWGTTCVVTTYKMGSTNQGGTFAWVAFK